MNAGFKDHFSGHATDYARYRPDYPAALYEFLAKTARRHEVAWDCGTGSGQAALGLAPYFDRVIATPATLELIELHALLHHGGYYIQGSAPVKALSEAMRYEVSLSRVNRVERGIYQLV